MILLAAPDESSLAAKKKQRHGALEMPTSTPKNRVWNFENGALGRPVVEHQISSETATGSVQFSYETASGRGYYYTWDQLKSTREMCDSSGNIVVRYNYDPYGRPTKISGSLDATFQYTADFYHASSGLNLTLSRAYDPTVGRWLGRDTLVDAERSQGPNLYEYVWNNPITHVDPLGLKVYLCCAPIQDTKTFMARASNTCGFRHCWIKTDTKEAGMGPSPPSKNLPSNPLGTPTEINDETGDSKTSTGVTCTEIPDEDEACVNRALQIGQATGKWGVTNNCNTLAQSILEKCSKCKKTPPVFPAPHL